jgi:hypothetical protein
MEMGFGFGGSNNTITLAKDSAKVTYQLEYFVEHTGEWKRSFFVHHSFASISDWIKENASDPTAVRIAEITDYHTERIIPH